MGQRSTSYRKSKNRTRRPIGKLIFGLLLVGFGAYLLLNRPRPTEQAQIPEPVNGEQQNNNKEEQKLDPLPNVQNILEDFVAENKGEYSVVVADIASGKSIGQFKIDKQYFAASLYKIYVAYLGYLDIQNGNASLESPFLGSWTRGECLDKMIRESHSPCAEKLWTEQGKANSTERLKKFGIKNTNMEALTTTAEDINTILLRLYNRQDLNDMHTDMFLSSLKENIYRDVLPAALPDLIVMDKVGFRELVEYHDAGIILLPDGRPVLISILTRNAGTKRMVLLTKAVFEPLINSETN